MNVCVVAVPGCLRSSDAITRDILATANRIAVELGRPTPFMHVESCVDAELVIVPGLGCVTEEDLTADLSAPTSRQLIGTLAACFAGGATLAASCRYFPLG